MKKLFHLVTVIAFAVVGAAGSPRNSATSASSSPTVTVGVADTQHPATSEVPAAVKEAVKESLPKAQSITPQHKDLTDAQAASVEKESGMKLADKDHDSYLVSADEGGTRKQIGVATVVKAQGRAIVIVYGVEKGEPVINDAHGESGWISHAFLDQFKGKGHDDKLRLGQDIKAQGVDEALARAITDVIRLDVVTMQTLYGAAHAR
jgi:hypothetical protein